MLSDERIEKVARSHGTGGWQTLDDMCRFARAIAREATAPLIERISLLERKLALFQQGKFDERMYQAGIEQEKQIKEDEALMRQAERLLIAVHSIEMIDLADLVPVIQRLRQRLEAKT